MSGRPSSTSGLLLVAILAVVACCSNAFLPQQSAKRVTYEKSTSSFSSSILNAKTIQTNLSSRIQQSSSSSSSSSGSSRVEKDESSRGSMFIPHLSTKALSFCAATVLSLATTFVPVPAAHAAGYGSLSDEQKLVAEAWRLVDNSFLDRTFGGQDWFQLRQKYVKQQKYKDPAQAQAAVQEMVQSLGDKYTRYLSPSKYQSIVDSATGTLAGVGIEISQNKDTGRIYASDVEVDAPASRGGIRPNDVFVEVDGTRFVDGTSTPDDVALKLRGPEKSKVGVVMERNGETLDFILTREPIKITAVRPYMSTVPGIGKVGVVRIKSFSGTTAETVAQALQNLQTQGAKAYVVDVRGNPGGLLPGGVATASLFLPENKPVVFVVNKSGVVDAQTTLTTGMLADESIPVVVLVDGATASAAEVFTAAMKENNRAVIAGEQTFGKGVVQTIRGLSDNNGGVAITVARYETTQHHDINLQGIPVTVSTKIDCPKDDAVACLDSSVFQQKKP